MQSKFRECYDSYKVYGFGWIVTIFFSCKFNQWIVESEDCESGLYESYDSSHEHYHQENLS